MDTTTARMLNQVTGEFYRLQAESFSATRHAAWAGWLRVLDGPAGAAFTCEDVPPAEVSVLAVGCGNLRFARFLAQRYPDLPLDYHALDSCAPLVDEGMLRECPNVRLRFYEHDILGALLDGGPQAVLPAPACDFVACFGFMHHVPGHERRVALLRALADAVKPGGYLALSFWQFMNSPELAERARETHARALAELAPRGLDPRQLEEGDYLLGWQGKPGTYRYCHNFTPAEIDALATEAGLAPQVVHRFEADGRTQTLNAYRVLTRPET